VASSVNYFTLLHNPTAGLLIIQPSVRILHVDNRFGSQTTFPSNLRISIAGTANFQAAGSERFVGVYGKSVAGVGVAADGLWPLHIAPSAAGAALPDTDPGGNRVPAGTFFYQSCAAIAIGVNA